MFIGHYALAFGAKRLAPRTSLGTLFAAAQFADLLWPAFLLLGWEQVSPGDHGFTALTFTSYPWSHSLLMSLVWAAVFAVVYHAARGDRQAAVVVGVLVFSHWVLDYITHVPDLPLYPGGSTRVGLGLWRSESATLVIECAMFVAGIALYVTATRARDWVGRYMLWVMIALLLAIYFSSLGPPPHDMRLLAWFALAGWLFPFWAAWCDRHRDTILADPRR